jgi:hypothetical protein
MEDTNMTKCDTNGCDHEAKYIQSIGLANPSSKLYRPVTEVRLCENCRAAMTSPLLKITNERVIQAR